MSPKVDIEEVIRYWQKKLEEPPTPKTGSPTTAQHTPGPWTMAEVDIRPAAPFPVTLIHGATRDNGVAWAIKGHKTSEANARLIAAAPEMFRLLKAIIRSGLPGDIEDTRALLAKIEGKES